MKNSGSTFLVAFNVFYISFRIQTYLGTNGPTGADVPLSIKQTNKQKILAAMQIILQPLRDFVVSFVDDIAVGSSNFELHIEQHIPAFLTAVRNSGLTLNLCKTEFVKPEVTFVGHVVGSGRKRQDPNRLEAIQRLVRPHTKKELRSTLGLLGYHRLFVPNYAEIAKPLTDLTMNRSPVVLPWTENEQRAFDRLKESLCLSTALHTPRIGQFIRVTNRCQGRSCWLPLESVIDSKPICQSSEC